MRKLKQPRRLTLMQLQNNPKQLPVQKIQSQNLSMMSQVKKRIKGNHNRQHS